MFLNPVKNAFWWEIYPESAGFERTLTQMQLSDVSNNVESIRHLIPNATLTNSITVRDFRAYLTPKALSFTGLLGGGLAIARDAWRMPGTYRATISEGTAHCLGGICASLNHPPRKST